MKTTYSPLQSLMNFLRSTSKTMTLPLCRMTAIPMLLLFTLMGTMSMQRDAQASFYIAGGALKSNSEFVDPDGDIGSSFELGYLFYRNRFGIEVGTWNYGSFFRNFENTDVRAKISGISTNMILKPINHLNFPVQPYFKAGIVVLENIYSLENASLDVDTTEIEAIDDQEFIGSGSFGVELQARHQLPLPVALYLEYTGLTAHTYLESDNYYAAGFRLDFDTSKYKKTKPKKGTVFSYEAYSKTGRRDVVPIYSKSDILFENSPFTRNELAAMSKHPFEKLYICGDNPDVHFGLLGVYNTQTNDYRLIIRYLLDNNIPFQEFASLRHFFASYKNILIGGFDDEEVYKKVVEIITQDIGLEYIIDYCALDRKITRYRLGEDDSNLNEIDVEQPITNNAVSVDAKESAPDAGDDDFNEELLSPIELEREIIDIDGAGDEIVRPQNDDAN